MTWVQNEACYDCGTNNNFDPETSSTWEWLSGENGRMYESSYGSGSVRGYWGTDTMCFEPDTLCAQNHRIMNVFSQTGLGKLSADGILGLSVGNALTP